MAAVLLEDDLALGDHVDLAEVGVHRLDVTPPPVGPAWLGRRQLTDADGAEVGDAHLVGHLVPVARPHVERSQGGAHDLVDILGAGGDGNVRCPQHDGHGHLLKPSPPWLPRYRGANLPPLPAGSPVGELLVGRDPALAEVDLGGAHAEPRVARASWSRSAGVVPGGPRRTSPSSVVTAMNSSRSGSLAGGCQVGGRARAGDELGEPGRRADEQGVGVLGGGLDGVGHVERDVIVLAWATISFAGPTQTVREPEITYTRSS